jgi:hypothetical protein
MGERMLRRFVPLLLILFVATAVVAAEVSVSDVALQTAPGSKRLPAIAAGDGGYLAVWLDARAWSFTLTATRIAANGEPLDPIGIPLGSAAFFQPQVLWNGDGYLVFWNDADYSTLMVTRVSRDGIAEAPRVLREHAPLDQRARAVATNGSHIVLAYRGDGQLRAGNGPMRIAVMTREGVLIDDRSIDVRNSWTPTVIANDHEFLVAWNVAGQDQQGDFVAVRLDSRGAAIDASPRKIGEGWDADILRNGSNYVAIADAPNYVSWSVSRDLAEIGTASPLPLNHYDRAPSLLDGSPAMMAVFESSEKVFVTAVTFDADGHEAGPRKRIVESVPSHFAVARGADALALIEVKPDDSYYTDALVGSIFDEGTLSRTAADRALALSASEESTPVIAGGGGRYLAVWTGPRGLTAGRFLPDGTRLDADGFVLDTGGSSPAVAFDGERFVVSYIRNIYNQNEAIVRFVSPDGGLLPDAQMVERTAYVASPVHLAVGGGVVLATWMREDGVYAAALRGTQVIAPARKIADTQGGGPVAQWNGRQFLVAWSETEWDWDVEESARLLSMRIESDLTPVDAQPRLLLERPVQDPVLAAWNGGWLVAFQNGYDIRLHEIDEDGTMNGTPLVSMPGYSPKLVNAAAHPWLAWTSPENHLLRASQIRPDGTLATDPALSITAPPFGYSFGYHSALGALGNDIAATYSRVTMEAGSVRRVFISTVKNANPRRRAVR